MLVWLALTVIGLGVGAIVWDRLGSNVNAAFDHARLSQALDNLFSSLQDAETGQRGFILTSNESFLEPFTRAEQNLPGQFSDLALMTSRNHLLQSSLLELRGLAELKMASLKEGIQARREHSPDSAQVRTVLARDKEAMDAIRKVAARMREQGQTSLADVGVATRRQLTRTQVLGLVIGFLGIGAGLFALYLVRVGYFQERTSQELLEGKLLAEKTAVEKTVFLANISHEIRTPMNAILGFSELLEGESLSNRQSQYVRSIQQSGRSLLQLVSDVLDLSRLEAGKLELRLEPTDLGEICNFLQTMFIQQATVKSLALGFEVNGIPSALLLDRLRLRQVLMNLIGNAIKFTSQGHVTTRVGWSPQAADLSRGVLLITVEDTGMGIPPEKQEEIFKPFVQSTSAAAARDAGAGLGLNIVQRLTQIMSGTITLQSTPGKGTTFYVRFPDVAVSARLPVNDAPEAGEFADFNDFEPATLLVVDDNEANRDLIAGMFAGTHHTLRSAANGEEALTSIAASRPDLVLLDIRMPAMDGLVVVDAIRKMPGLELLPVIAVTASTQKHNNDGEHRRFNGYIRKPFSRRTLYKELARFLRRVGGKAGAGGEPLIKPDAPPNAGPTRKAGDWNLLMTELRAIRSADWDGVRESLAINQTQALARKLHELAEAAQCEPLIIYADLLASHAQAYAVRDLEKHLAGFPALLKAIEQHRTSNNGNGD